MCLGNGDPFGWVPVSVDLCRIIPASTASSTAVAFNFASMIRCWMVALSGLRRIGIIRWGLPLT